MGRAHSGGFALTTFLENRPNVFLTAFFRSGSTHVKATLLNLLPNYRGVTSVISTGALGNDTCAINMFAAQLLFPTPESVFHQHTLGTHGNAYILKQYNYKPIVQMRNMLDSMVSVVELLAGGENQNLGIYYPHQFAEMSKDDQLWWAVKNLPNWYFTFYLSWKYCGLDTHTVWYDIYYKDQVAGVRGILNHVGFSDLGDVDDETIRMVSERVTSGSRFKFGLPGRGRQILTAKMVRDIEMLAMSWMEGKELIKELMER